MLPSKFDPVNQYWSVNYATGTLRRNRDFHPIRFSFTGSGIKWHTDEAPDYIRKRVERNAKDVF